MKKALIDENSVVVQVEQQQFDTAPPTFWVDCADDVVAYAYKYENGAIVPIPVIPKTADENKETAKQKLKDSDWAVLSDVNLQNKTEWETYRASLRVIVFNPQSGDINWPTKPQEIWG
jgi:hypothetical protein